MSIRPKIKIHGVSKKPLANPFGMVDQLLQAPVDSASGLTDDATDAMAMAFDTAAPAAMFDLELPWTSGQGRVLNKYGVQIAKFENWETADAVCAMMNGATDLLQKISELPKPAAPAAPATDDKVDSMSFMGIPLVVDPAMPATRAEVAASLEERRVLMQQILEAEAKQIRKNGRMKLDLGAGP